MPPSRPARSDYEARKRFIDDLQLSLSCAAKSVWKTYETAKAGVWDISLSATPTPLRRDGSPNLWLVARMLYSMYEDNGTRVKTHGYDYALSADPEMATALYSWHWHPATRADPHMHIAGAKIHLPTGRVSFEQVIRLVITEMNVIPLRRDWDKRLKQIEKTYLGARTWV